LQAKKDAIIDMNVVKYIWIALVQWLFLQHNAIMRISMKSLINTILLNMFCIGMSSQLFAQKARYGLAFNSFEAIQEKRTSLNLTPDAALFFPDGFILSFDVCFQSGYQRDFGYIFRIVAKEDPQQYIDFVVNITELTVSGSFCGIVAKCRFDDIQLGYDEFTPFEIDIDIKRNQLNISMKDKKFSAYTSSLKKLRHSYIVFGKSGFRQLQVSDVPKMAVKDIQIKNRKQEPVYFWSLSKHTSDGVYDEIKKKYASVENPQWLLDKHVFWEKHISFTMQSNPQITYNSEANCVVASDMTRFVAYYPDGRFPVDDKIVKGVSCSDKSNHLIYNPFLKNCYSYHISQETGKKVIPYDMQAKTWDNESVEMESVDYWHHNRFFSAADSCLYLFNGYGHHIYKSTVNKYDFSAQTWNKSDYMGDRIAPRYLSGAGAFDAHRALIFGGYGSETGAQELSSHNYYDLFMVDTRNMESKKIWELPPPETDFVVSNSMIVDTASRCFYALCFPRQVYNSSLSLYRFSLDNPEYEAFADNIPFKFEDIYSYSDLYLNKDRTELVAVAFSPIDPGVSTEVSVYTLAFPPLPESALYQKEDRAGWHFAIIVVLSVIISTIVCVFIIYKRKKRKGKEVSQMDIDSKATVMPQPQYGKKQAIFLFGGFQTFDKDSCNITSDFSTILKHLFLLILLYTLKNGKGISSKKLHEILWYNKTEESAKNNRSVSISKLRQTVEKIGAIRIKNHNSLWTIELGDDVYCDYYEALFLIEALADKANRTVQNVRRLLTIVSAGELLPNVQNEWIDPFKACFSNNLIDLFLELVQQTEPDISQQERIDMTDAILIHDPLNEDALKIKCKLLVEIGRNGLARKAYASFAKEYFSLFGKPFKSTFEQILA
jgi:two-component SAPR family response regulator